MGGSSSSRGGTRGCCQGGTLAVEVQVMQVVQDLADVVPPHIHIHSPSSSRLSPLVMNQCIGM